MFKFKRHYFGFFWPISPIFETKKVVSKTPADMHNFIWVYHHGNPGKSIDPIPTKQLADDKDWRTRTEGKRPGKTAAQMADRPYFIGPFWLPPGV